MRTESVENIIIPRTPGQLDHNLVPGLGRQALDTARFDPRRSKTWHAHREHVEANRRTVGHDFPQDPPGVVADALHVKRNRESDGVEETAEPNT